MVLGLKPTGKPSIKNKNHKCWTEPRACMVLGPKPTGRLTGRIKKKGGFWTSQYGLLDKKVRSFHPRLQHPKGLGPAKEQRRRRNAPVYNDLGGLFIQWAVRFETVIPHTASSLRLSPRLAGVSITFYWSALLCRALLLKLWQRLFIIKYFGLIRH